MIVHYYEAMFTGNLNKFKEECPIIFEAACDSCSILLSDFLKSRNNEFYRFAVDEDCNHLSLLYYLFCDAEKIDAILNIPCRGAISGCWIDENKLIVPFCSVDSEAAFFRKLVESSEYFNDFVVVCAEDEDLEGSEDSCNLNLSAI